MKIWVGLVSLSVLWMGATMPAQSDETITVIISGHASGHLTPCGCTKPMSGGLSRLATLVRSLKANGRVVWIDSGNTIENSGQQSQLKFEAYAEVMGKLGVDVAFFGKKDQLQGNSALYAGSNLLGKPWLANLREDGVTESRVMVEGLSVRPAGEEPSDIYISDEGKPKEAFGGLWVYRSDGTPAVSGNVVTPGSRLRGVVIARFRGKEFLGAKSMLLESAIPNEAEADKVMKSYLSRLTKARLIDQVPKTSDARFAGSQSCVSCHAKAAKVHFKSKHAVAYKTLVKEGHHADPDCVSCHVVGLESKQGFKFEKTPQFAEVGCESCHGPSADHARRPKQFRLPKVEEKSCRSCHSSTTSPGFNFLTYWKKIRH